MAFNVRHGNAVDMIMVLCPIQIMEMPYQRLETGIWLFSQNLETFPSKMVKNMNQTKILKAIP